MPPGGSIRIGTSGWSYPKGEGTWNGFFYPAGRLNELEYYSRFFDTVEINSSFYRPPTPAYAEKWARQTPDDFLFTAKLWQKFTHPGMYRQATGEDAAISQDDVDLFHRSLEPLVRRNKLGALLAQFPPGFTDIPYHRQVLEAVLKTFGQYRLAIELRHRSWSDDENTARLLALYRAAWVQIDEPKFPTSVAADVPPTSSEIAYFRFHGRNAAAWWQGNGETRYKYLYNPEEISSLAAKVGRAAAATKLSFAFFNNHWQAWAPRNANDLKKVLHMPIQEIRPLYPPEYEAKKQGVA